MRIVPVVVVLLLVAGGAWFTIGPGSGPPTAPCSAANAEPVASAAPVADPPQVEWDDVELPPAAAGAGEQILNDVETFADGFVAVGRSSSGPESHAFFLTSSDGLAWRADLADEHRFEKVDLWLLARADDRLFALGAASTNDRGGSRVAVWFTDDGRTWTEASGPFDERAPRALASGEDGLLMLGSANAGGHPVAWRSDDNGETWVAQRLELPVALAHGDIGALSPLGDGWNAAGSIGRNVDGPRAAVIWRSGDGISWSCHIIDASGFGFAQADQLHRAGASWLATGIASEPCDDTSSCIGYPMAWVSDGLRWSAPVTSDPVGLGGIAFAGTEEGFVAFGHGTTWYSSDGGSWTAIDARGPAHQPDALVVAPDGRMVVVGTEYTAAGNADAFVAAGDLEP